MPYDYSSGDGFYSLSFNLEHNGRNGLFTMGDTLTVSGVFTAPYVDATRLRVTVEMYGINAQNALAALPERFNTALYGNNCTCLTIIDDGTISVSRTPAGQPCSFTYNFEWSEARFRSDLSNRLPGSSGETGYLDRLEAAIPEMTQEEIAAATPVRYIGLPADFTAMDETGTWQGLPAPTAYWEWYWNGYSHYCVAAVYLTSGGEVNSAFYAAYPAFDVYYAQPAAPVVSSHGARDDAAVDAIAAFGGFAIGHSVPVFAAGFALDSHFPTLCATHALTLSGTVTASLTAVTAQGDTAVEFDLPQLAAGTVNYVYTVNDGWGSASVSGSFTAYAYAPPAVSAFSATRYVEELTEGQTAYVADVSGEHVWLDIAAQVASVHGGNAWESAITWWREDDEANADSDGLSLSASDGQAVSVTGNTAAGRGLFAQTLDAGSVWKLRITFTDCLGNSASAVATVDASGAILDLEPHGVAVGMRSTATAADPGKFEVAEDWSADLGGDVRVGGDLAVTGETNFYGPVWFHAGTNLGDGSFESLITNSYAGSGTVKIQRYGKVRFLFVVFRPSSAGSNKLIAQLDPSDAPGEDIVFACTGYSYPGQCEMVAGSDGKVILHAYGTPNNTLKGTVAYVVP